MAQSYRSLPSNFEDSPADGLNWPAKTVAGITRSVRISGRVSAACSAGTSASMSLDGQNLSRSGASPAERLISDARILDRVITVQLTERRVLTHPGRARDAECG